MVDSIILTSDTDIIQTGETATLTATALDSNNHPVENAILNIYQDGANKGTITTGSDGTATYTYTGSGVGDTQFCVTDGTIQSETYSIFDTLFYDDATTNAKESNWATSNLSVSYNNGRVVSNSSGSNVFHRILENGSLKSFNTPLAIEFDLIGYTGSIITVTDGTNQVRQGLGTIGATSNSTIRIEYDGTTAKFYVDGVYKPNAGITASNSSVSFGFRLSNGATLEYKNVKIYSL